MCRASQDGRSDLVIKRKDIPNPVLRRLIEEIRNEKPGSPTAYNRIHNRHNRGR